MPMLKELLSVYFQQALWKRAQVFPDGTSPDLTDARALRRKGIQSSGHREVYWPDAVVQGSMEMAVQHLAIKNQGYIQCSLCKQSLETAVWPHLVYSCPSIPSDFDNEGIQANGHLCLSAAGNLRN